MRAIFLSIQMLLLLSSVTARAELVSLETPRKVLVRCQSHEMDYEVWFYLSSEGRLVLDTPAIPKIFPHGDLASWKRLFAPETVTRIASADFDLYAEAPVFVHLTIQLKSYNRFMPIFPGRYHKASMDYRVDGSTITRSLECQFAADAGLSRF